MTAKETARELVNQFRRIADEKDLRAIKLEYAKQCALITVEELIKENYPQDIKRCIYLHNVKREIELL